MPKVSGFTLEACQTHADSLTGLLYTLPRLMAPDRLPHGRTPQAHQSAKACLIPLRQHRAKVTAT